MTKVHKVVLYITDLNDKYQDEEDVRLAIRQFSDREEAIIHIAEQKESEYFEWNDDLAINKRNATTEDFAKYIEADMDYEKMAKSFVGRTIEDFFCNGFFGSRTFDMEGAEIVRVYDNNYYNIVIEVKKRNGKYDYGYFNDDWYDWKYVYEHLKEWTEE